MAPPTLPPTPTLSEKHSGIPTRLLPKATLAKSLIYAGRTEPDAAPLTRGLPVPQGISKAAFLAALEELRELLGPEHVQVNDAQVTNGWYMEHANTHDMMPLLDAEEFIASAVAYPGSVEDVQRVVKWANKHLIPIFPISIGRNLGYGGAAPRVRGSVTLDLGRRMNRILDINADDFTCLVEPGVTFYALHEEIQRRGLGDKMWIDTPDLGGGSVVGNTLDRGVGYTPYGDHWMCHSGLEVVLPGVEEDGEVRVVRTGMGALGIGGENTWQCFPYGFGPFSEYVLALCFLCRKGDYCVRTLGVTDKSQRHLLAVKLWHRDENGHDTDAQPRRLRILCKSSPPFQVRLLTIHRCTHSPTKGTSPLSSKSYAPCAFPTSSKTWPSYATACRLSPLKGTLGPNTTRAKAPCLMT